MNLYIYVKEAIGEGGIFYLKQVKEVTILGASEEGYYCLMQTEEVTIVQCR